MTEKRRLKMLLFGPPGTYKTRTALQMPRPVLIDLEAGADWYIKKDDFNLLDVRAGEPIPTDIGDYNGIRICTSDPNAIFSIVDWLATGKHPYLTVIIDPITIYWASLQDYWCDALYKTNKGKTGDKGDHYELQIGDWHVIKADNKRLMRRLTDPHVGVDMNVVVTAHVATAYKEKGTMVFDGTKPDAEKSVGHIFDTKIETFQSRSGVVTAKCLKDRTNHFKEQENISFPLSPKFFIDLFGEELICRGSEPVEYITEEQANKLRGLLVIFTIEESNKNFKAKLSGYGANSINELTKDNAQELIDKFETAYETKKKDSTPTETGGPTVVQKLQIAAKNAKEKETENANSKL